MLDFFINHIENFDTETSRQTFGYDDYALVCRWPRTLAVEILDGVLTHVCISGVYDEINPDSSRQTDINEVVWDWWDANAANLSTNNAVYPDIDIILYNLNGIRDIEYGIKQFNNAIPNCYVLAIVSEGKVLGWDNTLFMASMLGLPTVPVINVRKVLGSREEYITGLTDTVNMSSIFGSISAADFKPVSKKGILVRNYDSFNLSNLNRSCFKIQNAPKQNEFKFHNRNAI